MSTYDDAISAFQKVITDAETVLRSQIATAAANAAELANEITSLDAAIAERDRTIVDLRARIAELEAEQEPTQKPDPGLWYQRPATSDKLVMAHFFGPFPISTDNADPASDYYARQFLTVNGESGKHAAYGGYLRDRPMGRPPIAGDWRAEDARTEIRDAQQAGVDGFYVNIMTAAGSNWDRYLKLADVAAAEFPGFKVVPMIDTNGDGVGKSTTAQLADAVARFFTKSSTWRLADGRHVLGSFKAEGKTPAWWADLLSQIKTRHRIDAAFVAVFVDIAKCAPYFGTAYAVGPWGYGSDPGVASGTSSYAAQAKAAGVKWLGCALNQNVRYAQGTFDESLGSGAIRASWDRLIREGADLVQMVTWSDFAEGSHIRPSVARGRAPLAIAGYYAAKWKTGQHPPILEDVLILAHRDQPLNTKPTTAQTKTLVQKDRSGRSPAADIVEALTYLTAPAEVMVSIGSEAHTYVAPAGEHVQRLPLRTGRIAGRVVRAGKNVASADSPFPVTATPRSQDRQYMFASSLGTEGQYPLINA